MKENSLEITKFIQTARKKYKEGNIYQANEIYKNLIDQKIYQGVPISKNQNPFFSIQYFWFFR